MQCIDSCYCYTNAVCRAWVWWSEAAGVSQDQVSLSASAQWRLQTPTPGEKMKNRAKLYLKIRNGLLSVGCFSSLVCDSDVFKICGSKLVSFSHPPSPEKMILLCFSLWVENHLHFPKTHTNRTFGHFITLKSFPVSSVLKVSDAFTWVFVEVSDGDSFSSNNWASFLLVEVSEGVELQFPVKNKRIKK